MDEVYFVEDHELVYFFRVKKKKSPLLLSLLLSFPFSGRLCCFYPAPLLWVATERPNEFLDVMPIDNFRYILHSFECLQVLLYVRRVTNFTDSSVLVIVLILALNISLVYAFSVEVWWSNVAGNDNPFFLCWQKFFCFFFI